MADRRATGRPAAIPTGAPALVGHATAVLRRAMPHHRKVPAAVFAATHLNFLLHTGAELEVEDIVDVIWRQNLGKHFTDQLKPNRLRIESKCRLAAALIIVDHSLRGRLVAVVRIQHIFKQLHDLSLHPSQGVR